jgi:hypothetical protein
MWIRLRSKEEGISFKSPWQNKLNTYGNKRNSFNRIRRRSLETSNVSRIKRMRLWMSIMRSRKASRAKMKRRSSWNSSRKRSKIDWTNEIESKRKRSKRKKRRNKN